MAKLMNEFANIFNIIEIEGEVLNAVCQLKKDNKKCGLIINADATGKLKKFNMWRHVKRHHKEQYDHYQKNKELEAASNTQEEIPCKKAKIEQKTVDQFFKSSKITITMDAKTFQEGLVEMVCLSGAPLNLFNLKGKGFQKIAGQLATEMSISLGNDAVRNFVITSADAARNELKADLKCNLVYLKMDAATRGSRNFLAVNVQFWCKSKKKMLIKMLDIIDTENQHSSEYIKKQVKKILEKFEIEESQVLSICVDNAANMVRVVKTFSEFSVDNEEIEQVDPIGCEENMTDQWCVHPQSILPDWLLDTDSPVQLMRCGIHTLQLAVWAGLNTEEAQIQLNKIRKAITKLRTPTFRSLLLKRFGLSQTAECVTRWGSTFLMLDRFLKFQEFCEEMGATGVCELNLDHDEWKAAKKTRDLLHEPYLTTLKLQAADLTPGIFCKEWCRLKKILFKEDGVISKKILISMKIREQNLFDNTHFLTAIYVDPRYRILLTPQQYTMAREGLLDIALRIVKLKRVAIVSLDCEHENLDCSSNSDDDEFEKELDEQEKRQISRNYSDEDLFKREFYRNCEIIEKLGRLKVVNVFDAFQHYPNSLQLACEVASSMPISQVSVERLFSSLKFIMNDLRFSIKDDLLAAILFFRCNCNDL